MVDGLSAIEPGTLLVAPESAGERASHVLCVFDRDPNEPGAVYALVVNLPTDTPAQPLAFGLFDCAEATRWWGGPTEEPLALVRHASPHDWDPRPAGDPRANVTETTALYLPGQDHAPRTPVEDLRVFQGSVWLSAGETAMYKHEGLVVRATDDFLFDDTPATLASRIRAMAPVNGAQAIPGPASFSDWSEEWLELATFKGPSCSDVKERIAQVLELWQRPIPEPWQRELDQRLLLRRYGRTHKHGKPTSGSEHEVEFEILGKEAESLPSRACFGETLVDGVSAVPLARDPGGKRAGNVEADLLLLTRDHDRHRQFLLEVKTTSNDAWYALVENLRQLRLFLESDAAKNLLAHRNPGVAPSTPVVSGVLAPPGYYSAKGKKKNATKYALLLIEEFQPLLPEPVTLTLAVWSDGAITELESSGLLA